MGESEIKKLLATQSYSINSISGASGTSTAVYNAIASALASAKGTIPKLASTGEKTKVVEYKNSGFQSTSGETSYETHTFNSAPDLDKLDTGLGISGSDQKKKAFKDGIYV